MKQQETPIKFSPVNGFPADEFLTHLRFANAWRCSVLSPVWRYNPWTGKPRRGSDIAEDPYGTLILPPGEPLMADSIEPSGEPLEAVLDRMDATARGMTELVSGLDVPLKETPAAGFDRCERKGREHARDTQLAGDHYKKMGVQPWDVIDTWPLDQRIGAYRAGALRYIMRMGSKDESAQEIAKDKHYLEKLLEVLNG